MSRAAGSGAGTLRVLIIEDLPDDAELLLRALRRAGLSPECHVVETPTGIADALRDPRWDIVLADFNVPGTDFTTILRLNREADPDRPVIIVSGSIGEETAVDLMRNGVADLVLKSNMARLAPAIIREVAAAKLKQARSDADQRFRNIVEATGDWVWESDENHRFTFFSNTIEANAWFDPAGHLGRTPWEMIGAEPEGDPGWQDHKADLAARRPFRNYRMRVANARAVRHLASNGVAFFDRDGVWRGYRGIMRDETPILEAYRQAEDAEKLLQDAVDSISEGFVVLDAEDRFVMVNEAFRDVHAAIADLIVPGAAFEDVLRVASRRGQYADAIGREDEWLAERIAERGRSGSDRVYRLKDGRWILVTERRMRNGGSAGLRMDITALKSAEAERDYLAYHDAVTGLPNQRLFDDRLAQALVQSQGSLESLAVLSLELTSLADIRASQGLEAGDAALHEAGRRILSALQPGDTVAHIGNGRYLAFSARAGSEARLSGTVGRIVQEAEGGFEFNGIDVPLRIAMGISLAPVDAEDPDGLSRAAATALSQVRANPLRRYQFYRAEMTHAAVLRGSMEADLRRAIARREFVLHYQPQVEARDFRVVGVEALLRWAHPERGLIAPGEFIPVAEETGLIVPLGELVLRQACTDAAAWGHRGATPVPVAVNMSAVQLAEPRLEDTVSTILSETGLAPGLLKLELTESAILSEITAATRTMRQLAERGIRFALDDFGMEHSSLSYVSRLPIDTLKVDFAFISKMTEDRAHAALVQAIIAMTHSLGMVAIAEGVERPDQLVYLQAYGCDVLQGYLFSRPVPLPTLLQILAAGSMTPGTA